MTRRTTCSTRHAPRFLPTERFRKKERLMLKLARYELHLRCGIVLLIWCAACLVWGCGSGGPVAAPVDSELARNTLQQVLERWEVGDQLEAVQELSPPIVVQDRDWSDGWRLKEYKMEDDGRSVDANLYCRVELSLESPEGKPVTKQVTYIVGTDPVLTVFRDVMP